MEVRVILYFFALWTLLVLLLSHFYFRIYSCYLLVYNRPLMTDNQKIDQHIKDKYKVIKKLGSGAYGHVSKVSPIDRPTQIYALKKVFEAFQHDTDAQRTYRQISILKKIEHPNIIKLYQVLPSVSGRDIYLVFEFMPTDLYKVIYQNNLQEVHIKFIMYQLLKGLNYLHSANLLHRDLKPSNLLLSPQCNLKICDFGLARHLNNEAGEQNVLTEGVATRWYRAPEVLLGSNSYDEKADLWSAGCILAEMILRNPLFNCNSTTAQFEKILQVVGRPSMEQIKQTNYEIANTLIKQLGQIRQKSSKQIFGHQNELCIDLIYKLLKFSPSKRISAKQAMMHPYLKDFFREQDLVGFKGQIKMQADQNVKLTTDKYKELISKHFILSKQTKKQEPQRFSDLKREKSFGKIIEQIHYRKSSGQKDIKQKPIHKNTHLFEYLLKQREASGGKVRVKSSSGSHYPQPNKQNLNMNKEPFLEKFSQQNKAIKPNGTFAALKKVTALKFNR